MIEDWIDALCERWAFSDERFGTVRSYKLVGETSFPDSIDPADLAMSPIALTIPAGMDVEYSEGGVRLGFYSGVTEFHVAPDLNRSRIPQLMPWYGRILEAAAGKMQLGVAGVEYFVIDRENGIQGPLSLQYGSEAQHWGFLVRWTVKERLNNLTVSR